MLTRSEAIFAKIEATYGQDSVPAGINAIALAGPVTANPAEQARFADRPVIRSGSIAKGAPIFGGALFGLQIPVEVKGAGSLGVAPEWGVLMRACGFAETIVGATSVTYKPTSTFGANSSCTIYYFQDGVRYRVTGCRGNVQFTGKVGEVMTLTFNMVGILNSGDPSDATAFTPTYQTTTPPTFLGSSMFTLDAYAPAFTEFSWDMQNEITAGANANAANGFGEVRIASRDLRGTIDPEMTLVASQDWLGDWKAGITQALTMTLGTAGGNRIVLTMPAVRYIEPAFDDRDGTRIVTLGYKAQETATLNDEISILLN